jgi:hypothetical protein
MANFIKNQLDLAAGFLRFIEDRDPMFFYIYQYLYFIHCCLVFTQYRKILYICCP